MQIIYIKDFEHDQYLGLNITHQTSTGWYDTLDAVTKLALTTNRKIEHWWGSLSKKSFEEVLTHLSSTGRYTIIDIYNDESTQSYIYW